MDKENKPVEWMTLPGVIIDEDTQTSPANMKAYVEENASKVSFIAHEVFSISNGKDYVIIIYNRFHPVWAFLNVDPDAFRKDFFG